MSEVKEWYKNAWYTPTMKKLKEEVDKLNEKINEAMELPESPSENGSYNLVRTVNEGAESDEWKEAEKELPAEPSVDGNYYLGCDVISGEGTKSWKPDESDLPTLPTQDGSYVLSATITSGEGSPSWIPYVAPSSPVPIRVTNISLS